MHLDCCVQSIFALGGQAAITFQLNGALKSAISTGLLRWEENPPGSLVDLCIHKTVLAGTQSLAAPSLLSVFTSPALFSTRSADHELDPSHLQPRASDLKSSVPHPPGEVCQRCRPIDWCTILFMDAALSVVNGLLRTAWCVTFEVLVVPSQAAQTGGNEHPKQQILVPAGSGSSQRALMLIRQAMPAPSANSDPQ